MHYPDKLIPSSKKGRDWTRKGVDLGSELTYWLTHGPWQVFGHFERLGRTSLSRWSRELWIGCRAPAIHEFWCKQP